MQIQVDKFIQLYSCIDLYTRLYANTGGQIYKVQLYSYIDLRARARASASTRQEKNCMKC